MDTNTIAPKPMFFRTNGDPINFVDLYRSQSVFLVCNGPSFREITPMRLKQPGILTFGLNNGAHMFRPNFWTGVDDPRRFMPSIWADGSITKFVPVDNFDTPIPGCPSVLASKQNRVRDFPNVVGFCLNDRFNPTKWLWEETINWGNSAEFGGIKSVMLPALRICYLLGFRNVYLVACDFYMSADSKYWFPEDRSPAAITGNTTAYAGLCEYFVRLLHHFNSAGFRVWNTNPSSRLQVFPFRGLDDAIRDNVIDISESTQGMYQSP